MYSISKVLLVGTPAVCAMKSSRHSSRGGLSTSKAPKKNRLDSFDPSQYGIQPPPSKQSGSNRKITASGHGKLANRKRSGDQGKPPASVSETKSFLIDLRSTSNQVYQRTHKEATEILNEGEAGGTSKKDGKQTQDMQQNYFAGTTLYSIDDNKESKGIKKGHCPTKKDNEYWDNEHRRSKSRSSMKSMKREASHWQQVTKENINNIKNGVRMLLHVEDNHYVSGTALAVRDGSSQPKMLFRNGESKVIVANKTFWVQRAHGEEKAESQREQLQHQSSDHDSSNNDFHAKKTEEKKVKALKALREQTKNRNWSVPAATGMDEHLKTKIYAMANLYPKKLSASMLPPIQPGNMQPNGLRTGSNRKDTLS